LSNREISALNNPSPIEVDKTEKVAISGFYDDSYYMAIHNKASYYPADKSTIDAYGFNDYVYRFIVGKNSRIVMYSIYKQMHDKRLPRFDVVYNMDGSVHTILETVKELGYGMRDCFEDNDGVVFHLIEEEKLPDVNKVAPPMQYDLKINKYSDVLFILERFKHRKNVKYRMHLTVGSEEIFPRQTVTDEEKIQINGSNVGYQAVSYGLECNECNYIVMVIKIPNTNNKLTYRFMNIFEIIKQYRGNNEELDSRLEDKNIVLDGDIPRKRKHNSETDSYASLKTTRDFYSKKDDI
jgi:hypothetical protein